MTSESSPIDPPQLTLSFSGASRRDFEQFVAGPNAGVLAAVKTAASGPSAIWPLIWGPGECGKTHLLVAASALSVSRGFRAIYVNAAALMDHGPEAFEAIDGAEFVCLDDIDRMFGHKDWEEGLFHAFNRLHRAGAGLVMSASSAPAGFDIRLGDLRSRLNWGTTHAIFPLDEDCRRKVLIARARVHGVTLDEDVLDYLMSRARRGIGDLVKLSDDVAALSFAEKRPITVPLVRQVLSARQGEQQ
jgi:DnaA family protein